MTYPFSIPENCVRIQALAPQHGTGAAQAATAISLKLCHKVWAVVSKNSGAGADAVAVVPQTDALVAFGTPAVLTTAVPHWVAADEATSPVLVRDTDAVNHTFAADALNGTVVFEIDPAELAAGEDCFRISLTAAAGTFVAVEYIIAPRYPAGSGFRPNYLVD